MKKQYTNIAGVRILFNYWAGYLNPPMRNRVKRLIEEGWTSTALPDGGWWIKAKIQIA